MDHPRKLVERSGGPTIHLFTRVQQFAFVATHHEKEATEGDVVEPMQWLEAHEGKAERCTRESVRMCIRIGCD